MFIKPFKTLGAMFVVLSALLLSGCFKDYGTLLEFGKGQLYYTSEVTSSEADRLGKYLVQEGFFNGNEITVQLNKAGETYEFRMVVKKGIESDQEYLKVFREFSSELSTNVFSKKQVDIHLCDDQLETLRVVVAI